jgi:nitrogen fixation/metabolism regulation signal transduction histidine kinase
MPASVTPFVPRPSSSGPPTRPVRPGGRPLWDSPRLILAGIAILVIALVAILTVASRSAASPDFLSEFVLYALSAADLTMLAALVFVLARHIVKLVVERRRGRPFARLRGKLVALLLGMTLIPAVLVLAVGSEIIRTNMDRWFTAPMDEILASANQMATEYRRERQALVQQHAERVARGVARLDLTAQDQRALRDLLLSDLALSHDVTLQVYRVRQTTVGGPELVPVFDVAGDALPAGYARDAADGLALQAVTGTVDATAEQPIDGDSTLLHAASAVRGTDGPPVGAVVATDVLRGEMAARSRRMTQAFEQYSRLRVLKSPLTGVYRCSCSLLRRARSAPAGWTSASSRKAMTNSACWPKSSTRWPANSPAAVAMSTSRRRNSSGATWKWSSAAATLRPFSSASRPASSPSTPPAR